MLRTLPILLVSLLFVSCAGLERCFHSDKDLINPPLDPVQLVVGEETLAVKHRTISWMAGGYLDTLFVEDPEVVKVERVSLNSGLKTYITGLKVGKTQACYLNVFSGEEVINATFKDPSSRRATRSVFEIEVVPAGEDE